MPVIKTNTLLKKSDLTHFFISLFPFLYKTVISSLAALSPRVGKGVGDGWTPPKKGGRGEGPRVTS